MNIKLRHKILREEYTVATATTDADTPSQAQITEGHSTKILVDELQKASGFYGHIINLDSVTNLDLAAAIAQLPSFEVLEIEGAPEVLSRPKDVQT